MGDHTQSRNRGRKPGILHSEIGRCQHSHPAWKNHNPTITFYKIITHNSQLLESYGIINTDVEFGKEPMSIMKNAKNPSNLY